MASTPKQVNGNGSSNNSLGKRKKSHGKSSYLSKWLDKTMSHIQDSTPNMDTYDFVAPSMNMNWAMGGSQFAPGYDPYRNMYGTTEPLSLPTLPNYHNPPMMNFYGQDNRYMQNVNKSIQVQRARVRRRNEHKAEEVQNTSNYLSNDTELQPKVSTDNLDYASLPPIITSVGDTNSNSDRHEKDKDETSNNRRYSDPCVHGLPDIAQPANVDSESDLDSDSTDSQMGSKLLICLLDQISSLKRANERLNKDLMDTRVELENMRHHNALMHKGTSSSMGHTPSHSLDNGLIGGQYNPGFLTDLVREIRDAARIREEALYTRVRAMVLERTENLASSEAKLTEKTLDEIKDETRRASSRRGEVSTVDKASSLRAAEAEKRRMMDRINKLEDDMQALRVTSGRLDQNDSKLINGNIEDSEAECIRLRKELADMRKAKQTAEDNSHKLERLVTQLRSKSNGHQLTNGPDSLPSEPEHELNVRVRRASINSSTNSTVVFGPVTDL